MALILDETFAAGIPGSFATARSQSGALTVAHNAGAGAVDLSSATAAHNIWDITSQSLMTSGEMEIDLEFVSDNSGANNYRHAGIWAVAGAAAVSNGTRFTHYLSTYLMDQWTGAVSWAGNASSTSMTQWNTAPFNTAADRRTFNLRWDMSAGAGVTRWATEGRIDGVLCQMQTQTFASLRPGIHVYQCAVRLHGIKVWDAPQAALKDIVGNGLAAAVSPMTMAPASGIMSSPPATWDLQQTVGKFNWYNNFQPGAAGNARFDWSGGDGQISGTTKNIGAPNTPVSRKVQVYDKRTQLLAGEQWSSAVDGSFLFTFLNRARTYTVVAYDHTLTYASVLADNVVPT